MLQFEILILKLLSINTLSASAIASCEVTTLNHELFDDAVKAAALVRKWHACLSNAFLTGTERPEVLSGLGNNTAVKLESDTTDGRRANADVEEDAGA